MLRSRLYCRTHRGLFLVTRCTAGASAVTLSCGCLRSIETMELKSHRFVPATSERKPPHVEIESANVILDDGLFVRERSKPRRRREQ